MNYKLRCQKSQNTMYTAGVTEHTLPPTRLLIPLACTQIVAYLYLEINPRARNM